MEVICQNKYPAVWQSFSVGGFPIWCHFLVKQDNMSFSQISFHVKRVGTFRLLVLCRANVPLAGGLGMNMAGTSVKVGRLCMQFHH